MKRLFFGLIVFALVVLWAAGAMVYQAHAGGESSPPAAGPTPAPTPKGSGPAGPATVSTAFATVNGNPLKLLVATDGSAQVLYNYVPPVSPNGQFYPAGSDNADMGIFLWVGQSAYGPNVGAHSGGSAYGTGPIAFNELGQSAITGSGSGADPFIITTRLGAGNTGLSVAQKLTYVNGQQYYRMDSMISNTTTNPMIVTYFHAGDIFLKGSDNGYGYYDPGTGAIGGKNQTQDWFVLFQPISPPASKYEENNYGTIWDKIGHGGAQGVGFQNIVRPADYIDNGAGLEWSNVNVPANGSATISDYLTFGVQPVVIGPPPPPPPAPTQVPEGDTLILVGSGLAGLAGYAGLRWRARRAK